MPANSTQRRGGPPTVVDVLSAPTTPTTPPATPPDSQDGTVPQPPQPAPLPVPEPQPEPGPLPSLQPGAGSGRPVPESELTPEQRQIRHLEDQLARERGRKDPQIELESTEPGAQGNVLIHFLEDGFTALGQVWYRGQELEVAPGSGAYADTCDRLGHSWLELRHDEFGQVERFGKVMFRAGPWPGKPLVEAAKVPFESLRSLHGDSAAAGPSESELAEAAKAEARRRRAAPRLPAH